MLTIPVPTKLCKGKFRQSNKEGVYTYCAIGWILKHTKYRFGTSDSMAHLGPLSGFQGSWSNIWEEEFWPLAVANDKADSYSKRIKILRDFVATCPNLVMEDD